MRILKRLKAPFNNRKGLSVIGISYTMLILIAVLSMATFLALKFQDIAYTRKVNAHANTIADVIAENKELTAEMQTVLYENLGYLKSYGGSYTITYQTYSFSNPLNKVTLGVSKDGQIAGNFTVNRGDIIRVMIATETSPLDRFSRTFTREDSVGVKASRSYKVD